MRKHMGLWFGVLLVAGCGGSFPGVEGGFETVRMSRGQCCGFLEGGIIDVTVARDGAAAVLSGTRALRGDPETDTCLRAASFWNEEGSCVLETPVERVLDAGEVEQLQTLLSMIPGKGCIGNPLTFCEPPPVFRWIEVDGRSVDDDCCGDMADGFQPAVEAVFVYVDSLVAG